jgi:hypothetical protein
MNRKIFTILSFAVLMFLLGTWAATAQVFPVTADFLDDLEFSSFLPMIYTEDTTADLPCGVLHVFSTGAKTNGNVGGRAEMHQFCYNEVPDSHFCSLHEIENAMATSGIFFHPEFEDSWVDFLPALGTLVLSIETGEPAASSWYSGDNCYSWESDYDSQYGTIILNHAKDLTKVFCDSETSVACCKRIP